MLIGLLANAYAPEAIILCGSLMDRCSILRQVIMQACTEQYTQFINPKFDIVFSNFGPDGNIIGAATIAFNYNIEQIIARSSTAQ